MTPDALSATLERIAWAAAGALELREVFPAVAEAAAAILPFDRVSLLQFDGPRILRLYTLAGRLPAPSPETEVSLEDLSPGIRPSLHSARRIEDLEPVLSPTYKVDRWWGEQRLRSALWVPIILRGQPGGFLCLTSRTAGAFTPQHEAAIGSIGSCVWPALEHEPLRTLHVPRPRRLEAVDRLLPTMATALDLRRVFARVAQRVQPLLRHG